MHLVIGLGNPGPKYEKTRHNVGFKVLDRLAELLQVEWKDDKQSKSEVIETQYLGEKLVLAKPQTYMNLSGQAVQALAQRFKVTTNNILVAYDEVALPLGTIRVRQGGSSGGHNGIKSLIECLNSQDFARFRLGINLPPEAIALENYVVGHFTTDEQPIINAAITATASLILEQLRTGVKELSQEIKNEAPSRSKTS